MTMTLYLGKVSIKHHRTIGLVPSLLPAKTVNQSHLHQVFKVQIHRLFRDIPRLHLLSLTDKSRWASDGKWEVLGAVSQSKRLLLQQSCLNFRNVSPAQRKKNSMQLPTVLDK
jgi:hypothetical protein